MALLTETKAQLFKQLLDLSYMLSFNVHYMIIHAASKGWVLLHAGQKAKGRQQR